MPNSELQRINSFLTAFARRQAARIVDLPGGFAVYDAAFAHSRANNQVIIDTAVDSEALPAIAEEALGHLPHRLISVLDNEIGMACAEPLIRAGYTHSTYLVMLHAGPVPAGRPAEETDLDAIRIPLTRRWRDLLPDVDDEVIRHLVDRREARRRGADVVHFIGARTEGVRSPHGPTSTWTRQPAQRRSRT
ncbi:GNAT family N-acetyltransferase [Streptomyces sp. NPDC055287]